MATQEGGQGKRLLLLGHLDTVFEKGSSVPLWERQGERVRGQGVNDMKGGDVIMIEALRALGRQPTRHVGDDQLQGKLPTDATH